MKKTLVTACAALVLAAWLAFTASQAHAIEVGQQAPDMELPASTTAARLSGLKGKVVYVDFWASWCGPCKQSFPWMNEMQRKYGARGLQVLAINLDANRPDAEQFLAENPAAFALAFDSRGDTARRIGVKGMPTSLLLGPDGKVLHVHQGFRADERAGLEARLLSALGVGAP